MTASPNNTFPDDDLSLYEGIVDIEDLSELASINSQITGASEAYPDLQSLGSTATDMVAPTLSSTSAIQQPGATGNPFGGQVVSPLNQDETNSATNRTMNNGKEASLDTMSIQDSNRTANENQNDEYELYKLQPDSSWPPPMYIKRNVSPDERYYMEHRWNSQWTFFDKKATENKNLYHRYQWIIGVGSVAVPVLVGINPADNLARDLLYFLTVAISLSVAISAAIENIYKYGDNWRSYRQAAEELKQEKSLYDAKAGRYLSPVNRFVSFVERCEEVVAQQNGRWIQAAEKQQAIAAEQVQDILDDYQDSTYNTPSGIRTAFAGDSSPSFRTDYTTQQSTPNPQPAIQAAQVAQPTAMPNDVAMYDVPTDDTGPSYNVEDYDVPVDDLSHVDIG